MSVKDLSSLDIAGVELALKGAFPEPYRGLRALALLMIEGLRVTNRIRVPKGQTRRLFRGARMKKGEYAGWMGLVDRVVLFPPFTSFSLTHAIAAGFPMGEEPVSEDEVEVMFEIETVSRPLIDERSRFRAENEVLFHPFSAVEVLFVGTVPFAYETGRPRFAIDLRDLTVAATRMAIPARMAVAGLGGGPASEQRFGRTEFAPENPDRIQWG